MSKKSIKNIKILLTGGHAARTALAVIEELVKREGQKYYWEIYWVGSEKAIEGKNVSTMESKFIPEARVKRVNIIAGRVQMKFTFWTIPSLIKIPIGMIHGLLILTKIKPDIVLSFGAYASYPIVVNAKLLRIPVVIHEQTAVAGRANIQSARFAKIIAISRKTSKKYFPDSKIVFTGNPVISQMTEIGSKQNISNPPVIYITGGSRGSITVNNSIEAILHELLKKYIVIHQTGEVEFERFKQIKENLDKKLAENYQVYSFIDPYQLDNVFRQSDLVVSRAGANTVSDILVSKRPSILIPIPFSYLDEQTKNAKYAQDLGVAEIISQDKLTGKTLLSKINYVFSKWQIFNKKFEKYTSSDVGASKRLVDCIEEVVDEKKT